MMGLGQRGYFCNDEITPRLRKSKQARDIICKLNFKYSHVWKRNSYDIVCHREDN